MGTPSDLPPRGLRWTQRGEIEAVVRPKHSRFVLCLFASAWNLALGPLHLVGARSPSPPGFDLLGLIAGAAFLLLAVRELLLEVRVTCEGGRLHVRGGAMAPWLRFEVPIVDISDVVVLPDVERGTHEVWLRMRAGAAQKLPVKLEGIALGIKGRRKLLFPAPVSHASFVAGRVLEMLDAARHAGHDTFRT
jgi:hypothetical protein